MYLELQFDIFPPFTPNQTKLTGKIYNRINGPF